MLGPLDEFPVHQIPQPIAWVGSSDRNFYDRAYLNAHDRTGNIFLITGIGYYPNLGVKDAFVLIARRGAGDGPHAATHTGIQLSAAIDQDRLNQHCHGYRIEVLDPYQKLRVVLEETDGVSVDLTWQAACPAVQEQPHVLRNGNRAIIDTQRFAQLGRWSGQIAIDGEQIEVDPLTWVGSRDRSWGIRTAGEPEPAGAPANPPREGMWWLYVPVTFDEFSIVLIVQELADGFRLLNDCTRVWKDGRLEQLGWPRVEVTYRSGTRTPTGATIHASTPDGTPVRIDVESKLAVPIHIGSGYAPGPDWQHGTWQGETYIKRVDYDMTDPAHLALAGFGVQDHVGRALYHEGQNTPIEGWGLFEHGIFGRHDPSGFTDWSSVAP